MYFVVIGLDGQPLGEGVEDFLNNLTAPCLNKSSLLQ